MLELVLFAVVVALQIPAIISAKFPILRAAITLGVLVPLYLLVFARLYLSGSLSDPGTFSQPLDHATALYFTVTVFATVGFGDIVAKTDTMRLVVTAQMLINLIVVGASSGSWSRQRGVVSPSAGDGVDVGERDRPVD